MLRSKQDRKSQTATDSQKKRVARKSRDTVDYRALAEFRLQLRRFLEFSEANTRKNNLTSQQYQALLTIKGLSRPDYHMSRG